LRVAIAGGVALVGAVSCAKTGGRSDVLSERSSTTLSGIQIIDPHAHPDMDYVDAHWPDRSSSYRYMQDIHLAASSFSAVGDRIYRNNNLGKSAFKNTLKQLDWWLQGIINENKVKLVLKIADIPQQSGESQLPGAIFSIEGKLENLDEFYKTGVRIITLMHYHKFLP